MLFNKIPKEVSMDKKALGPPNHNKAMGPSKYNKGEKIQGFWRLLSQSSKLKSHKMKSKT